jgi:hypothetical protein
VNDKTLVHEFWNTASCGEALYLDGSNAAGYVRQLETRYRLEPYIRDFARFQDWTGKDVLEIGVGLGADHQSFAEVGARLCGIDLTERAIEHTVARFDLLGLHSDLRVADAPGPAVRRQRCSPLTACGERVRERGLKPSNGCGITCRRGTVPASEAPAQCLKAWRRGGVGMIDNKVTCCYY